MQKSAAKSLLESNLPKSYILAEYLGAYVVLFDRETAQIRGNVGGI